jgi:hypothetical protein
MMTKMKRWMAGIALVALVAAGGVEVAKVSEYQPPLPGAYQSDKVADWQPPLPGSYTV